MTSKAHMESFNLAIGKLQLLPEFKVYIDELKEMREEIIKNGYAKCNSDESLKLIGLIKGITLAMEIQDRYKDIK